MKKSIDRIGVVLFKLRAKLKIVLVCITVLFIFGQNCSLDGESTDNGDESSDPNVYDYSGDLRCICFGNDNFVAIGTQSFERTYSLGGGGCGSYYTPGKHSPFPPETHSHTVYEITAVSYNFDRRSWIVSEIYSSTTYKDVRAIAHGNGRFVIAGNRVWWSVDGISWSESSTGGSDLYAIAYGNGRFVTAGTSGTVWWSADGINWSESSPGGPDLYAIAYGDGRFVAVGTSGKAWWSADSTSWSESSPVGPDLYAIAYGNGRFVAVGASGRIWWSEDGSAGSWIELS